MEKTKREQVVKQILALINTIKYGSIEIYFHDGKIIQVTERRINKINEA